MEKIPGRRFSTAQEMRNALLNLHASNINDYNNRNNNIVMPPVTHERDDKNLKKKKLTPTGIALIVIAILGLLSGLFFRMGDGLFGAEVAVPNVENLNIKEADQTLKDAGLKMQIIAEQPDEEVDKDSVISQNPAQGQKDKKGREVKVIISTGAEEQRVPNLIGYNLDEAEVLLNNKGLKIGKVTETYDEKYEENEVVSQNPEEGSKVSSGTKINVVVSKGKEMNRVVMPNLVGLSLAEAKSKLEENKLVLDEVTRQESTAYFADRVMSQDTTPGVLVEEQTPIKVVVSKGPGPSAQTKVIEFTLPSQQDYYKVSIKVKDAEGEREVYNQLHQAADTVSVGVTYLGSGSAEVLLNGKHYKTIPL
jgi:serine/threonine-protein kinase